MNQTLSDLKLRYNFGKLLIDLTSRLSRRANLDDEFKVYWGTFISDQYLLNERKTIVNVHKLQEKIQSVIRNNSDFDAIGIIENQAITNYPKGKIGKSLSIHGHVLLFGGTDKENLLKRSKGFKTTLTKKPILINSTNIQEGSFTKLARYMAKPPYEGKRVDYNKLEAGKACLKSVTNSLKKYHHFRLFEYMAKMPIEHMKFGVGEGANMRRRLIKDLRNWNISRKGEPLDLSDKVYPMSEDILRNNRKLKNYAPVIVNYKR